MYYCIACSTLFLQSVDSQLHIFYLPRVWRQYQQFFQCSSLWRVLLDRFIFVDYVPITLLYVEFNLGLCSRGKPQYVTGQSVQACTTNANCNPGYECTASQFGGGGSICCMMPSLFIYLVVLKFSFQKTLFQQLCVLFHLMPAVNVLESLQLQCRCGISILVWEHANSFHSTDAAETQTTLKVKLCVRQLVEVNSQQVLKLNNFLCDKFYSVINHLANPCPAGRNPQINSVTGQPTLCTFGGTGAACGSGYSCAYSSTAANYYCCTPIGGKNYHSVYLL